MLILNVVTFGQFKLEGEIRTRMEFRDGYKLIKPVDAVSILLVSQRSRLGISYDSKLYTTHFSFQDVRYWGEEQIKTNQLNLALHEAWVEFKMNSNLNLKIGRQVLKYDNQRLIASSNWNQIGAKHDAIKLAYSSSGWNLEFVGALNQSGNYLIQSPYLLFNKQYKNLGILWLQKKWDQLSLASLTIVEGLRQDDVSEIVHTRLTSGITVKLQLENSNFESRLFYQSGKKYNGTSVNAYLFNLEVNQKFDSHYSLIGGIELKSGNETPDLINGTDHAFDILYGSRHKLNGLIDYFSVPSTTKGLGLADFYLKFTSLVSKKTSINLDYHYFKTPKNFSFEGLNYKSYLGSEIDLSCSIKISPEINITNIFSLMLPTSSMTLVKGSEYDNTNTGFYFVTMLTFKPIF